MTHTVLVVEDDREINELVGEYLSLENIRYLPATTGKEGIHQAVTQRPDALILDLMLPDITGFEVARSLSTHRDTYDIPIIVLSCMCQESHKREGFGAGALYYMTKPFLPDDLLVTLRQALDWKAGLKSRPSASTFQLAADDCANAKAIHLMTADLFAQTDLQDPHIAGIRDAFETLAGWTKQWLTGHAGKPPLRIAYRIDATAIEWKLSEDTPGLLADAFFRPVSGNGGGGGGVGGGAVRGLLMSWGAGVMPKSSTPTTLPAAPALQWLDILTKTGAARFERDSATHSITFSRKIGITPPSPATPIVPVEELSPTREQVHIGV